MKPCIKRLLFFTSLVLSLSTYGQIPFSRGVDISGWFQASSAGQIQFTEFTRQDLINIKTLGANVFRLPVNLHEMTSGTPDFIPDPLMMSFLDSVVTWAEDLHLYIIIDNHSEMSSLTPSAMQDELVKEWTFLSHHYASRSDYVIYEVLNEPHDIAASTWGSIQGAVINAIRTQDTQHKIVVGGVNYNSYTELSGIPVYTDNKLIYTFHFYDPFMFTHQGATWVSPSMAPLSGVPFPYNAAEMPACPPSLVGTWIESSLNSYPTQGTVAYVKSLIDIAAAFKNNRNVPVYCGELGVYNLNADPADRVYWYGMVRRYLEEKGIPWTTWDYKGSFGLFEKNSNELFDYDLNIPLVDTLGFNIPPQKEWVSFADSVPFPIYTDYIASNIHDDSYSAGAISYYNSNKPNNGIYCLGWYNFAQYNAVGFKFAPVKDLSRLKNEGYAVDFLVRGNYTGIKFDIRFLDTKTSAADHPWRMKYTVDNSLAAWDNKWHHVHIDLSAFTEGGSWDNGTWYNAQGLFDWKAVDSFQASSEYAVSAGTDIWFDNIYVTNLDTAQVRETGTVGINEVKYDDAVGFRLQPNPFIYETRLTCSLINRSRVMVYISDMSGNRVRSLEDGVLTAGDYTFTWDGLSSSGVPVQAGIYFCIFNTPHQTFVLRVVKAR